MTVSASLSKIAPGAAPSATKATTPSATHAAASFAAKTATSLVASLPANYNKPAFLIATLAYIGIGSVAAYAYLYEPEVKPLELSGSTVTLNLAQFSTGGEVAPALSDPTPVTPDPTPVEPEPLPEPEVQPEPEPEVQPEPEPEVKPEPEPIPTPAPVVKHKKERVHPEKVHPRKERPLERPKEHLRKEHPRKEQRRPLTQDTMAQANANPNAQSQASSPVAGAQHAPIMVFGRDQHPVLIKIKAAIDQSLLYPRKARMMRLEGTAVVQFTYTKDRQIRGLRILKSTGHPELDAATKQTIIRAAPNFPSVDHNFTLRLPITFNII